MSYDPNWFYSSLAQCAAAIVGLLGAVIATRLQEQYSNSRTTYESVFGHLKHFRNTVEMRVREVDQYTEFVNKRIQELEAAISKGQDSIMVTQELYLFGGSQSGPGWPIKTDSTNLDKYKKMRTLAGQTLTVVHSLKNLSTVEEALNCGSTIAELEANLPSECRGEMNNWKNSIQNIKETYAIHLRTTSIKVTLTVTLILTWLCIFGLLMPLSYLSAYEPVSKNIIMLAFGVGVSALPIYIFYELSRIFRLKDIKI